MALFDLDRLTNEVNKFAKYNNIAPVSEIKSQPDVDISIEPPKVKTPVFESDDPDLTIQQTTEITGIKKPSLKKIGVTLGTSLALTMAALFSAKSMFTTVEKVKDGNNEKEVTQYSYTRIGAFFIIIAVAVFFLLNKFVDIL